MRASVIARNYASTLFTLAERHGGEGGAERYDEAMRMVAAAIREEPRVREFLASPRVSVEEKRGVIRKAFEGRVPDLVLRFLLVTTEKRRAGLLVEISAAFHELVDESLGRLRADIRLARPADEALQQRIRETLEQQFGSAVLPTFRVDPGVVGGVVIRVGDRVMDGSLRRRITQMRRRMLNTRIPASAA